MHFTTQVSRRLHEEHDATLLLWARAQRDPLGIAREALAALRGEIGRHFEFEEKSLFPLLAAGGQGELCDMLAGEHGVIRDAAAHAEALLAGGRHDALRLVMLQLAEEIISHASKEEVSLLPAVDDALSPEADEQLTLEYAAV
jgi:hemerythrin-like domain-containing protein